jgi:site-specific recombinase XerD
MVSQTVASNLSGLIHTAEKERFVSVTEKSGTTTSTAKNETRSILFIRESIKNTEISDETINISNASWRDSTKQQYRNYHQKWLQFCSKKQINPFKANINNVLSFLTDLFKSGLGYSSMNTARCALSSYFSLDNSVNISSNVLVKRFMKGVYTLRPALPRYNVTWDVNVVLTYLKGLSPLESLSLLQISQKLLMLLLLLSGQRGQTIHLMDIKNIFITEDNVKIVIGDLLKNSKPGKQLGELNFPAFTDKDLS